MPRMDEDLRATARAFEADPTDGDAAKRYETALLRSGDSAEVSRRYRVAMLCDKEWSSLPRDQFSDPSKVRFCRDCRRLVFRVSTPEELEARVRVGDCVMAMIGKDPGKQDLYFSLVSGLEPGFVAEADKKRAYQEAPEVQARRLPCVIEMSKEQHDAAVVAARSRRLALEWGMETMGRVVSDEKHT